MEYNTFEPFHRSPLLPASRGHIDDAEDGSQTVKPSTHSLLPTNPCDTPKPRCHERFIISTTLDLNN